jgi:hypothetical protein
MVDTLALGASAARHGGSSPLPGTKEKEGLRTFFFFDSGRARNQVRSRFWRRKAEGWFRPESVAIWRSQMRAPLPGTRLKTTLQNSIAIGINPTYTLGVRSDVLRSSF